MEIFARSDLASFGPTEDGHDYTAPVYFVVAEDEDGRRWSHFHRFPGAYILDTPEGFHHVDRWEQAEAEVAALVERMKVFTLLLVYEMVWEPIVPEYG